MRAHDETDESLNGKWVSFIRFQLKTNPSFRQFHEKFTRTRGIDYTSKTSVNDILVRLFIHRSKMPACFQHLLMKVKDAAKREVLALAVRYSCVNELINCIIQSSGGLMVIQYVWERIVQVSWQVNFLVLQNFYVQIIFTG